MKVALLCSSKSGMEATLFRRPDERWDEEDEPPPPPDLLAECDSDETISAVEQVLQERYQVFRIESDEKAYARLKRLKPHLVFNISERLFGPSRESHIPTVCEMLNIPYTGSDPLTLGICLDKSRAKEILSCHRIPNPPFWIIESPGDMPSGIRLPAIVKPLFEGSSKGIKNNSLVRTAAELHERVNEVMALYKQPAIVERFIGGREFTVGVVGNYPNHEILPIVEIDHGQLPAGAAPIYSYEAKWIWDTPAKPLDIFKCPAETSADLKRKIETIVTRTFAVLRIRDWCRIDVRLDEKGEPNILEVNPLPGILPNPDDNSCLPKAARTAGYSYSDLIHRVVDEAVQRCGLRTTRVRSTVVERPAVQAARA
jgi:D-alanine-D-alanine ligase